MRRQDGVWEVSRGLSWDVVLAVTAQGWGLRKSRKTDRDEGGPIG